MLRLSFPGLEGVLKKHFNNVDSDCYKGAIEAYLIWDHLHFYSVAELELIAKNIGFRKLEAVEYGKSKFSELSNLDTRSHQIGLNTYVELTK